jgi:hypothetical protein
MFVTVQIPIADMRRFVNDETGRLALPPWPLADPAKHFVRAVGPVRRRRRGGVPEWVGESLYCDARHALVFADHGALRHQLGDQVYLTPLYRRFVATGRVKWSDSVARIDVGFRVSGRNPNGRLTGRRLPLPGQAALAALTVEARIPPNDKSRLVVNAGGLIAERIREVTTSLTAPPVHDRSWWVQSGSPLVLVEAPFKPEWLGLLRPPMDIGTPSPGNNDALALHHFSHIEYQGSMIPVWTLFYSETIPSETLRLLRIHLWRLHNEHEVLRLVLAACIQGLLDPAQSTLRDYLARQSNALRQPTREGFPQSDILSRAYAIDSLVNASYIEELKTILSDVSPGLAASVQPLIENKGTTLVQALYITNYGEVKVVENTDNRDFSQNIEGGSVGAVISGQASVSGGNFQGSGTQNIQILDHVDMSKLSDELARLVTELSQKAATPDQRADVELVRGAADAAQQGDKKSVWGFLKRVGQWVLDNATQIGVTVAATVIAAAI